MTASVAPLTSTAAGALLPDWEAAADVVVVIRMPPWSTKLATCLSILSGSA